ncbi:Kelch repeat-containing protein [Emticicia fontis]
MIRILLTTLFFISGFRVLLAQSGTIATDGMYVPRISTIQRNAIAAPANGQMIYNTDDDCFNIYQKDVWQKLCGYDMAVSHSDDWVKKGDFGGTARQGAVGFSIGSKGYIGTGGASTSPTMSDFWEYDPTTDVWTQKANFGGGVRRSAVGFSIGNKGYVGTGSGTGSVARDDFWEYNPATNTWTQKANVGGGTRTDGVGFSIGNKGYIGTGVNKEDFWEYDTTANVWTQKANVGGGVRNGAVGFTIAGKGYVGTGIAASIRKTDFWEYDPTTNTWTQKANFGGTARYGAVGFALANKGYIASGHDGTPLRDTWEYSPTANTWTEKSSFWRDGRSEAVGFAIGSKGYVGTGFSLDRSGDPFAIKDFWDYTPNLGNLTISGNLTINGTLTSPNFDAPTLLNSWVNFGSPYATAGYYKDKESVVHLKGMIKGGTTTRPTILFNLPAACWPAQTMVFTVASGDGTFGRVDVTTLGQVQFYSGVNTYLSLDGITFRADN